MLPLQKGSAGSLRQIDSFRERDVLLVVLHLPRARI